MRTPGAIKREEKVDQRSADLQKAEKVKRVKKVLQPINMAEKTRYEYKLEQVGSLLEDIFGGKATGNILTVDDLRVILRPDGRFIVTLNEAFVLPNAEKVNELLQIIKHLRNGII